MSKLFGSVGVTGLPSVREGDADSACCLWFCLVMYVCPFFPLVFGMGFGFWFGRFLGHSVYSIFEKTGGHVINRCLQTHVPFRG